MSVTPPKNLSAVSLTPVKNFSSLTLAINFRLFGYFWPLSTTLGKNVITGVIDTGGKLFAGVNDSTDDKLYWWQRSALAAKLSPAAEVGHGPDQRPRRPPKLRQAKMALFSFGGLKGLWSRCVGCLWMQLFMVVPMTPMAAVADFGGQRYRRFIPFNFLLSLVSTTPAINLFRRCHWHRWIVYHRWCWHRW